MKHSSKKMKFFFKKWLAFEKAHGSDASVEHVKQRALDAMLAQPRKAKGHDDRAKQRPLGLVEAISMPLDLATKGANNVVLDQLQQQRRPAVMYLPSRSPSYGKCLALATCN
ncbi:hypothetical protein GGI16_003566 [Coemansia sp. S142-1]|nr:hypothetical protein GGI16_003566 [Coemansia sp. S142-1]